MKKYLSEFNEKSLSEAKEKWIDDAIKCEMPISEIEKVFDYASGHMDYKNTKNDSLSYAVFCEETNECLAVVDVVVSNNNPQKKLIKMLTIDLCPNLVNALYTDDMAKIDAVIGVYSRATLGTILLTSSHKVDIVKLYGRGSPMRLLLKSLETGINSSPDFKSTAKWEGLWLTVERKN